MHDSKNKVLVKNIASLGVVQIVNYIFPLITIPYVARIIGPDGFGTIIYITALVSYFVLIISFGFDFTATRQLTASPNDYIRRSKIFSEVTGSRIILFLGCVLMFILCFQFFEILSQNIKLSVILFLSVFTPLLTPQYIFQGMQKLSVLSYFTLFKGLINAVLIFSLISSKDDLLIYASIGIFSNLLVNISALLYVVFVIKVRFFVFPLNHYFQYLKNSRHIFFSSVVYSLYTTANTIILGLYATTAEIGFYTTAVGLIIILQTIINVPVSSSLFPYIGSAFSVSKEEGLQKLRKILPLVLYGTVLICLSLIILAPWIVTLIYGEAFRDSVNVVRILGMIPVLSVLGGSMGIQVMLNLKMDKTFLKITALGAAFSIVSNFIMGYYFNYIGVSITYLTTEVLIVIGLFYALKQKNINVFCKKYFLPGNVLSQIKSFLA